eukprot:1152973-Pelagomonas_calceolata.AAC.7
MRRSRHEGLDIPVNTLLTVSYEALQGWTLLSSHDGPHGPVGDGEEQIGTVMWRVGRTVVSHCLLLVDGLLLINCGGQASRDASMPGIPSVDAGHPRVDVRRH